MTHAAWLLALLLVSPSAADKDKEKDKKKPEAAAKAAVSAEDLVRQAEEKAAAGDAAGAKELLEKAAAMPSASGDVSLKLGRLLQSTHDLDAAMDAYKSAGEKLTAAGKGEALGRLARRAGGDRRQGPLVRGAKPARPRHPGPRGPARQESGPGRGPPGPGPRVRGQARHPRRDRGAAEGGGARSRQRGGAVPARLRAAHAQARRGGR